MKLILPFSYHLHCSLTLVTEVRFYFNYFLASDDFLFADNLCKQFGPKSGQTMTIDTLFVFLKEFFEKINFENSRQTTTKA